MSVSSAKPKRNDVSEGRHTEATLYCPVQGNDAWHHQVCVALGQARGRRSLVCRASYEERKRRMRSWLPRMQSRWHIPKLFPWLPAGVVWCGAPASGSWYRSRSCWCWSWVEAASP